MERSQILDMMGTLKLFGMRSAYDEIMASGIKRQHEPPRIVGDLLQSEIAEKQARSIKYQITVAKLPLAKDSTTSTSPTRRPMKGCCASSRPGLPRRTAQYHSGRRDRHGKVPPFHRARPRSDPQRCTRSLLQRGRSRQSTRDGSTWRQTRAACGLHNQARLRRHGRTRLSPIRPGRRPVSLPFDQQALRADLDHLNDQPGVRRVAGRVRRREDDRRPPRPAHPSLRDYRDWK
ncbi:hypothetical protein M728_005491 (plasmid) [Ensifer sp. WSM1721]